MNAKEFNDQWELIKLEATPLFDQADDLQKQLRPVMRQLERLSTEKFKLQHTFFGCFTCKHAVDNALGKSPCCSTHVGHEGVLVGDKSPHIKDQSPACDAYEEGTPQHRADDPIDLLKKMLFASDDEDSSEKSN